MTAAERAVIAAELGRVRRRISRGAVSSWDLETLDDVIAALLNEAMPALTERPL